MTSYHQTLQLPKLTDCYYQTRNSR